MVSDPATFALAFAAVFGGIAAYLVVIDRRARELEARLATLEASTTSAKTDEAEE